MSLHNVTDLNNNIKKLVHFIYKIINQLQFVESILLLL